MRVQYICVILSDDTKVWSILSQEKQELAAHVWRLNNAFVKFEKRHDASEYQVQALANFVLEMVDGRN